MPGYDGFSVGERVVVSCDLSDYHEMTGVIDGWVQEDLCVVKFDQPLDEGACIYHASMFTHELEHIDPSRPEPIRRGDVVQWLQSHDPHSRPIAHTGTVTSDFNGCICVGYVPVGDASDLVRIGRARYYPDGTPVED